MKKPRRELLPGVYFWLLFGYYDRRKLLHVTK